MIRSPRRVRTASAISSPAVLLLGVACCVVAPRPAAADDIAAKGREIVARQAPAVVRVTATVKQDVAGFGVQFGAGGERTTEAIGTVIDPSGIVVIAANQLTPRFDGFSMMIVGEAKKVEMKTELSKPVIHLADGTELPARIVLEDPDTWLTYVVPEKPAPKPLATVPQEAAPAARQLDEVLVISRLAKTFGNEPSAGISRITAIVSKPCRGYEISSTFQYGPAFDSAGRFIGCISMVMSTASATTASESFLIIPAADIAEVAKQVRERTAAPAER
jgi:hypothetical protein